MDYFSPWYVVPTQVSYAMRPVWGQHTMDQNDPSQVVSIKKVVTPSCQLLV